MKLLAVALNVGSVTAETSVVNTLFRLDVAVVNACGLLMRVVRSLLMVCRSGTSFEQAAANAGSEVGAAPDAVGLGDVSAARCGGCSAAGCR